MGEEWNLQAGAASISITPPFGGELSGYGFFLNRVSRSIRRHLYATALVLAQEDTYIALVTADLLAVSAEITARTRAAISSATGIPEENVLIACSHTHSGPATIFLRGCGEVDTPYVSLLPRQLTTAVVEARYALEPVVCYAAQSTLPGMAVNRVDRNGAVDNEVQALEILGEDRNVLLFSFGCHPVSSLPSDAMIDSDFPGDARRLLELDLYDEALFLQGSCGDINPFNAHKEASARTGKMLAGAILMAVGQSTRVENTHPLRCVRRIIELPLAVPTREALQRRRDDNRALLAQRPPDSPEARTARFWVEATESLLAQLTGEPDPWLEILRDAQQTIAERMGREALLNELAEALDLPPDAVLKLLRLQQEHEAASHSVPQTLACELQAVQIGDIVLLAHPTELFAEFGLEIKRRSPFPRTFIVGYANDFLGYIPNEAEFARRGYAADTVPYMLDLFPYAPNVGRVFVEACVGLLNDLHAGKE